MGAQGAAVFRRRNNPNLPSKNPRNGREIRSLVLLTREVLTALTDLTGATLNNPYGKEGFADYPTTRRPRGRIYP